MVRRPAVAGQFYSASEKNLTKQLEEMTEKIQPKEKAVGVILPHAGYIYSGSVAGAVVSRIVIPETIILLGPNHTGIGSTFSLYKKGRWQTPLGEINIDSDLAELINAESALVSEDESAHTYEHSLEVQLPFFQHFKKDFSIVPIVLSKADIDACKELANGIAAAIQSFKKNVLIVASSDMTHYETEEFAKRNDNIALESILKLDEDTLLEKIGEYNITMCGYIPVIVMLSAAKSLGAKSAKLVKYQTSAKVSGDYEAVVGYAGVIVQ